MVGQVHQDIEKAYGKIPAQASWTANQPVSQLFITTESNLTWLKPPIHHKKEHLITGYCKGHLQTYI